ncbi:MAG TPA: transcriptional regulator SdiA, partial [Shigella sp.]|nr:transcriptional regulator SdiA [Shigella sp.]
MGCTHAESFILISSGETETGNDSNVLIVFYVQIMPDDFV